jgi:hypothetical protein
MPYRNSPNSTNWTNHDVDSYLLGRFRHFGGTRKSKLSVWRVLSLSFTSFAYNRVYVSILCSNSSRFVSALNYHKDELTFWDLSAVRNCVSCLLKTGIHFFHSHRLSESELQAARNATFSDPCHVNKAGKLLCRPVGSLVAWRPGTVVRLDSHTYKAVEVISRTSDTHLTYKIPAGISSTPDISLSASSITKQAV